MANVSTIADIRAAAQAAVQVVELPGWGEEPVFFKLRRTSARIMVRDGRIPNALMAAAQRMIEGTGGRGQGVPLEKSMQLMEVIVRDAMVEPTYDELQGAGIELTDDQVGAIVNFAQSGITALARFRQQQRNADAGGDVQGVAGQTE